MLKRYESTEQKKLADKAAEFIPYNRPAVSGNEQRYIAQVFERGKFGGGGLMSQKCNAWLRDNFNAPGAYVTTSGTHALEMAALLCELRPGDEVILPSFTFPTTGTSFARCGASLVFVDIDPVTLNIDPKCVEAAITANTKAIVAVHYAGVSCFMEPLVHLAEKHHLILIEDAAQAICSQYRGEPCGSFGTFGCLSFHETKNVHCGEGGALIVNDPQYVERAEIILEKGTNRLKFFRGEVDKYTWVDIGSSYVLGELNAAYLLAQLENAYEITLDRLRTWDQYHRLLLPLAERGLISIPEIPEACAPNGHLFWIKAKDREERDDLIAFLKAYGIHSVFHYVPLHSSEAGKKFGRFVGEDLYTTRESTRLLRLPLFHRFTHCERVVQTIEEFYA